MRRTGLTYQLHVDHWGGTGRPHARARAVLRLDAGYGVLIDTSRYITVSIGLGVRLASPTSRRSSIAPRNRQSWSAHPRVRRRRGARSRAGRGRLPVRRPDAARRGAPLQPVLRRRRAAAEVGSRLPASRADAVHRAAGARRGRGSSGRAAIPLDVLGLEPGWQSARIRGRSCGTATRFPDPDGFLARLIARRRPREPLVQPVRLADVAAVSRAAAVRRVAPRLERHRPRLLAARRARAVFGVTSTACSASRPPR